MSAKSLHFAIWGISQQYQVFYRSPQLGDAVVREALRDVRGLVKYQSVELSYYSVAWVEDYEVYTAYIALYDWLNRKNGYAAVSLFVPVGKRLRDGPLRLLDQLMERYKSHQVTSDYKIKKGAAQWESFVALVEGAELVDDVGYEKYGGGLGVVRYAPAELSGFLSNPFLLAFADYTKVFFLPSGQRRISGSSRLQEILDEQGLPPRPAPRKADLGNAMIEPVTPAGLPGLASNTAQVTSFIPASPPKALSEEAQIQVGKEDRPVDGSPVSKSGADGARAFEESAQVPPEEAKPSFDISQGEDSASIPETQAKVDKWFQNTSVWVKTKRWLDGPATATFLLREALTGGKIIPADTPAKLTVVNLGGTFYSKADVLEIKGLYPEDELVGYVHVEGYQQTRFEYTVLEAIPENGQLSPVEIRMPEVTIRPVKASNALEAPSAILVPKKRKAGSKKSGNKPWLLPTAGLLGLLGGVFIVGISWFSAGSEVAENDFAPTIQEQQEDRLRTEDAEVVERQDLTRELIAFANAVELFQTQQYNVRLDLFKQSNRLAFTTPEQRDVIRARIVVMQAAAKADYRVRATTSRAAGMKELEALLMDDRLTISQRTFLQQRFSGYREADDEQAVAKDKFSDKLRDEVNDAKLYPLPSYLRLLGQVDKNEVFSATEKKVLRSRLKMMQRVAQIKRDEDKGLFPPDNPLAKLANGKDLTKAQRAFVRKLAE